MIAMEPIYGNPEAKCYTECVEVPILGHDF